MPKRKEDIGMKKRNITTIILVVVLLLVTAGSGYAFAESNSSKLGTVNSKLKEAKSELEEGEQKSNELVSQISDLNTQIQSVESEISALDTQIENTQADITQSEADLQAKQEELDNQNDSLGKRLRAMYKNGETSILEILLGSSSLDEFMTNVDMVQRIYSNDVDVLENIQTQYDAIEEERERLVTLKNQLSTQENEQKTKKSDLESKKSEVETLQSQVESDNDALEAQIDELNKEANELTALIQQEQRSQTASSSTTSKYTGGVFTWPCPGNYRISSYYGYRIHPILHTRKLHTGLDIPATTGTPIVAAADGTVIMSKYYSGYGNCIMVDHGGGLVSVYGHCSALKASVGQSVTRGQTIALVGSTGQSTGPHLHFEVRVNGQRTSPLAYLGM